MVEAQVTGSTGRDSWISDVPPFSFSRATNETAASAVADKPQKKLEHRSSPPQADLGLYQEDLLSDSDHDRKDGSISPVAYPRRRDSLL
jgi:hypothetical protein